MQFQYMNVNIVQQILTTTKIIKFSALSNISNARVPY